MPNFTADAETTVAAMKAAIERAPSWRDRDPIVFDVRTNGGGSSAWGHQLLRALYGKDFVAARLNPLFTKQYVEWRVSPGNLEHVRTFATAIRASGAGPAAEKDLQSFVARFGRALAEGKSLWRDRGDDEETRPAPTRAPANPANPVAGRVFLLTDTRCASACLDFADMVRAMPGAVHVGRTTSADSVYMELRDVGFLPSGVGQIRFRDEGLPQPPPRQQPALRSPPHLERQHRRHRRAGEMDPVAADRAARPLTPTLRRLPRRRVRRARRRRFGAASTNSA